LTATPAARRPRSWLGLLLPALLAFAVLISLGTWQIERKAWKEALIAALTERLAAPPSTLPAAANWSSLERAREEYRRVTFDGTFDHGREALVYAAASSFRPDVSGQGYWVFTPARLGDGSAVIVNRGFIPQQLKDAASRAGGQVGGPIKIIGAMRWPDIRSWFSPHDDPRHNLWFARDPQAIAAAKGLGPVAPFYVEMESPTPPGGWPQPGKIVVRLRNEHWQYALTWYSLALALVVVFAAWAINSSRAGARSDGGQRSQDPSRSL